MSRVRSDLRTYWRDPGYWRWLWRERVSGQAKGAIAVMVAVAFGIAGYLSAERLAPPEEAATFTTQRIVTVVRKTGAFMPPTVVTTTTTQSGERDVVTVRRDGRTVVVRAPGETVTEALTVRGPIQERVVTDTRTNTVLQTETVDRLRTVTMPGLTETVTRVVTEPARTVTATVTKEVTVTELVTVTTTVRPGPPDP
jgi:hypothetical protein